MSEYVFQHKEEHVVFGLDHTTLYNDDEINKPLWWANGLEWAADIENREAKGVYIVGFSAPGAFGSKQAKKDIFHWLENARISYELPNNVAGSMSLKKLYKPKLEKDEKELVELEHPIKLTREQILRASKPSFFLVNSPYPQDKRTVFDNIVDNQNQSQGLVQLDLVLHVIYTY